MKISLKAEVLVKMLSRISFMAWILMLNASCGFLSEDNRSGGRGNVVVDQGTPALPPGGSADAQLGDRTGSIQKIIVKSFVRPIETSAASQFDLVFNPSEMVPATSAFSELAAPVVAAEKTIVCNPSLRPDAVRCIVYGLNRNVIPNGDLATLTFTIVNVAVSNPQVRIENLVMSTPGANPLPLAK